MSGAKSFFINRKRSLVLKFLAGAVALFILLVILNFFNSGIRNNFFALSAPLQKFFWSAGESSSGFLASIFNGGSFFKENQNLKSENQKLLEQVVSLQAIIGGNQAQSTVSSACQNDEFKLQMAGVVGLEKEDNLTINKGSASGILEGMPVITEQKALLGKISKVYKDYSEVMLISNKNSVINVRILQSNPEIDGVLKGSGGLQVYLDLVPVDDTLNSGDTLVTSALEGTFPKDLLVGKITKVEKNDQNPHQQAQVQPFFNISSDNLFVITNYKQK